MKLIINYDFLDAIRDVKEPYGPMKLVRNNKQNYLMHLPLWIGLDYLFFKNVEEIITAIAFEYALLLSSDLLAERDLGIDMYATMSTKKLKKLVTELKELNIKTDYDLLLKSVLYDKKYKISFNKDKIPFLMEEKYILVPTYNFNGQIKDTPILQEHEMGTRQYILSVSSPAKSYRLVLSNAKV